jgi:hypothetical protein
MERMSIRGRPARRAMSRRRRGLKRSVGQKEMQHEMEREKETDVVTSQSTSAIGRRQVNFHSSSITRRDREKTDLEPSRLLGRFLARREPWSFRLRDGRERISQLGRHLDAQDGCDLHPMAMKK